MSDSPSESTQSHPLHGTDRDLIDRLLACEAPGDGELTELARLLIRYDGFPGAEDLHVTCLSFMVRSAGAAVVR